MHLDEWERKDMWCGYKDVIRAVAAEKSGQSSSLAAGRGTVEALLS